MQIIVQRGAGDHPGPDIAGELLTTRQAMLARGRQQLDYYAPDRMLTTVAAGALPHRYPGELIGVKHAEGSPVGMLRVWAKSGNLVEGENTVEWSLETNLQVELLDDDA